MRVFIAGATGAIGRRLVQRLVAKGHSVIGLTHSPERASFIDSLGAEPAIADGLDPTAIKQVVDAAKPQIIVHEMTELSGTSDLRKFDRAFAQSNQLRTKGTDNLLAAGREAGMVRFVAQSYCGWPYARTGGPIKTESDPLDPDPPRELRRSLDAIRYLEHTVTHTVRPQGIVLRYGTFYGQGTGMLDASVLGQIRRHRMPLIGDGGGWWSFLHIDDAAEATALAIESDKTGIYNIVDDDPAPVHNWLPALATMLEAKPPLHLPQWLARFVAGRHLVTMMTQSRAGSNAKAK
jgi:2-alkyl-3-oxoalkanoate reductase